MKKLVITTSAVLTDSKRSELEGRLAKKYGASLFEYHVDEELLGGMILFDGTTVYDGSCRGMLRQAAELLKK